MSRRVVAPILLLLAAACSIAAVFVVHRIETRGGPLSQPSATTYFSPNGDGAQDVAEVRFTTREPERVTVEVIAVRDDGVHITVDRLLDHARVDGEKTVEWDGTGENGQRVLDGTYRFAIRRAGDSRTYAPTKMTTLDTVAPIGVVDRATLELGELRGLALLADDEHLEVFERGNSTALTGIRQFRPNPESQGARPQGPAPEDSIPTRFTVSIEGTPERIDVVDKAGNRRTVFPDPRVDYSAAG